MHALQSSSMWNWYASDQSLLWPCWRLKTRSARQKSPCSMVPYSRCSLTHLARLQRVRLIRLRSWSFIDFSFFIALVNLVNFPFKFLVVGSYVTQHFYNTLAWWTRLLFPCLSSRWVPILLDSSISILPGVLAWYGSCSVLSTYCTGSWCHFCLLGAFRL